MENLVAAFFERDLTGSEELQLDSLLESSPEEAFRFLETAKTLYLQTGLPYPDIPPPSGGASAFGGSNLLWGLTAGVLTAGAVWWALENDPKPLVITAPPAPALSPAEPVKKSVPLPRRPSAVRRSGTVQPEPYQEGHKYEGLHLIISQAEAGLITVRILDAQGKEVRLLFASFLEAGQWNFSWDGRKGNGQLAEAGSYEVETQSGQTILRKEIKIVREPAP